ncbi:MAG: hypothetical protein H9W81_07470 [Enterococcus sp.]|nr:hypothetical protein [Enterococcus sp.]
MSSILSKGSGKKPATNKSGKSGKTFSGNKTWFVFALVPAIAAAAILFTLLSQLVATTTYYVLSTDVPARSQVTADMLTEVVASQGSEPRNALGLEDVSDPDNPVYAKFALNMGDILTASNTGEQIALHEGIPEDYVVASFVADANNAVAGKLATGNYIDIIATNGDNGTAKYALRHVLLLDVSSDPNAIGEGTEITEGEEGTEVAAADQMRTGVPSLYTVALPEKDAATLALVRDANILVVLSPKSSDKAFQDKTIKSSLDEIYNEDPVSNSGRGTDPTFGQSKDVEVETKSAEESASPTATPTEEAPAEDAPADEVTEETGEE